MEIIITVASVITAVGVISGAVFTIVEGVKTAVI